MNTLRVPVASIPPGGFAVDVVVPAATLQPKDVEGLPLETIAVHGVLEEMGQEYVFRGTVSGCITRPCDRCLETVDVAFEVEVLWSFKPGPTTPFPAAAEDEDDGDAAVYPFDGNEIDLAPEVWEEAVLAAPLKFLCREDCAGLCPHCGVNLNRERCTCGVEKPMENKGLAGLADMLPRLKPKSSEE